MTATGLFPARRAHLGIDLGSGTTRVVDRRGELLFDEPSVCCFRGDGTTPAIVAAGVEAHRFMAKVAKPLKIVHPLENGVLSDMAAARELLRFVRVKLGSLRMNRRPTPLIGVPADATQAERRALVTAALDAGFAPPVLAPEPLLAAIGLGLPVGEARGQLIVDCGAGITEAAVISLGGMCVSRSWRGGGQSLNRAIADHLHLSHRFQIGDHSAEQLKVDLSAAFEAGQPDREVRVRGSDLTAGLPRSLSLAASEFLDIWRRFNQRIAATVRAALAETSPELTHDVMDSGLHLAGGAAATGLLATVLAEQTGIAIHRPAEPSRSVAAGLGIVLD